MIRSITGSTLEEQLLPASRIINFSDESAVLTVSTLVRHAWKSIPPINLASHSSSLTAAELPPGSPDANSEDKSGAVALGAFMRDASYITAEERASTPKNPDLTVHTPWRDQIYHHWNHVFYDVMNFLTDAAAGVGHLEPPSHDVLPLYWPKDEAAGDEESGVWKGSWPTPVLLIPAYIGEGVALRILPAETRDEGETMIEFKEGEGESMTQIFWLKKGTEVTIVVEGTDGNKGELAAVMAVAVLCEYEDSLHSLTIM